MAAMARVQLIIPDDDRVRFGDQARQEGLSLNAWIRVAARERLDRQSSVGSVTSRDETKAFFAECDTLPAPRQSLTGNNASPSSTDLAGTARRTHGLRRRVHVRRERASPASEVRP